MSEDHDTSKGDLEDAAAEGPLPGVAEQDRAEQEGREDSHVPGSDDEDDDPGSGVIMGAVNQH